MDVFETIGFGEWDAVGDTQNWNFRNVTDINVTNSILSGTVSLLDGALNIIGENTLTINGLLHIDKAP